MNHGFAHDGIYGPEVNYGGVPYRRDDPNEGRWDEDEDQLDTDVQASYTDDMTNTNEISEDTKSKWVAAVLDGNTNLGLVEFAEQLNETLVDPDFLVDCAAELDRAKENFREAVRPLAVRVLGQWAEDDRAAGRAGRSWTALVITADDGVRVQFTETVHGMGHNEVTTHKTKTCDVTGQKV